MSLNKDMEDIRFGDRNEIPSEILEKMVNELLEKNIQTQEDMDKTIKSFQKKKSYGTPVSKRQLLRSYREICKSKNTNPEQKFTRFLQTHPIRSESGVMVVAVVLSPYPNGQNFTCQWDCWYCPNQPGQPRSYLKEEPGVLRANKCGFDPVLQMHDRLESYITNGHPTDKLEIIVLGGTWASYPENYQYDFITGLYYAANIFFDEERRPVLNLADEIKLNETAECRVIGLTLETRPDCINAKELEKFREMGVTRVQIGVQHFDDRRLERINRQCPTWKTIGAIKMLKDNCFKVDIHLMPDLPKQIRQGEEIDELWEGFDDFGTQLNSLINKISNKLDDDTKFSDYIASIDDNGNLKENTKNNNKKNIIPSFLSIFIWSILSIFSLIMKGNTIISSYIFHKKTIKIENKENITIKNVKDMTVKEKLVHLKKMIDSKKQLIDWNYDAKASDKQMIIDATENPNYQADQWKLYPFQVTPYSRMELEYKMGFHKSYVEEISENGNELIELLLFAKEKVPEWIRVNRVIRDIPSQYIQGGCPCPNLNQHLIDMMKKKGKYCRDIRSREVRDRECDINSAKFCVRPYEASGGTEYFLSYESQDESLLYGFLRLRITDTPGICGKQILFEELMDCALIRELHVYGKTISVNDGKNANSSQHIGLGSRLLQEAEKLAKEKGFQKIAVISGVGVRDYYRKRGYNDQKYFLIKQFD